MLKPTPPELNPEVTRRRNTRNWALLAGLLGFVAIVFIVSVVKMSGGH